MSLVLTTAVLAAFGLLCFMLGLVSGHDLHGRVADYAHWIWAVLLVLAIGAMQGVAA